jgi:hypothetical protein
MTAILLADTVAIIALTDRHRGRARLVTVGRARHTHDEHDEHEET